MPNRKYTWSDASSRRIMQALGVRSVADGNCVDYLDPWKVQEAIRAEGFDVERHVQEFCNDLAGINPRLAVTLAETLFRIVLRSQRFIKEVRRNEAAYLDELNVVPYPEEDE